MIRQNGLHHFLKKPTQSPKLTTGESPYLRSLLWTGLGPSVFFSTSWLRPQQPTGTDGSSVGRDVKFSRRPSLINIQFLRGCSTKARRILMADTRACLPDGATNCVRVTTAARLGTSDFSYTGKTQVQNMLAIWPTPPIHIWHNYHPARASRIDNPDGYNNIVAALKHRDRIYICKIALWYPKSARNWIYFRKQQRVRSQLGPRSFFDPNTTTMDHWWCPSFLMRYWG